MRKCSADGNYGGFILTFEPARTIRVIDTLAAIGQAAESFSAEDWSFESCELVFLARRKPRVEIVGAALMRKMGGNGGTRRIKMRLTEPVIFESAIGANEAAHGEGLPGFISTAERLKRIEPAIWDSLVDTILFLRPKYAPALMALRARRIEDRRILSPDAKSDRLLEQRDGIGLVLEIAGIDRRPILQSVRPEKIESAKSILEILDAQPLAERSLVEQDSKLFGMELSERPSVEFSRTRGRAVRVYVVDSTPIETATGVDLLIYQEEYNSFILLQYKAMEFDSVVTGWSYKIDGSNVDEQLRTITELRAAFPKSAGADCVYDQRLNSDPFYFKFCERTRLGAREDSLSAGFSVNALHLYEFLRMPVASSERHGRRVGYKNLDRHLSNSEFISLARSGWIGSQACSSSVIADVVAAREGGRSAIFAVIQKHQLRRQDGNKSLY